LIGGRFLACRESYSDRRGRAVMRRSSATPILERRLRQKAWFLPPANNSRSTLRV
jgi:hypothetical protein